MLTVHYGDNLAFLEAAVARGERYDLVELDGPYGAGLEAWDCLDDAAYLAHYQARLSLVRRLLTPSGAVYVAGYPERISLLHAWIVQSKTLSLRRWIHWHKLITAHKGRKVEVFTLWGPYADGSLFPAFRAMLRERRKALGLTIAQARERCGLPPVAGGGLLWYEAESSKPPTVPVYLALKRGLGLPDEFDALPGMGAFAGVTDIDYIGRLYEEPTGALNDAGLRAKPMGLYEDLFRPLHPDIQPRRALILYGGSGNAAHAAGRCGYAVTVCETNPARCVAIGRAFAWKVLHRDDTPLTELGPLFSHLAAIPA